MVQNHQRHLQCSLWYPTHPDAVSLKQRHSGCGSDSSQQATLQQDPKRSNKAAPSGWDTARLPAASPWQTKVTAHRAETSFQQSCSALLRVPNGNRAFTGITWKSRCSRLTTFLFITVKGKGECSRLKVMFKVGLHWNPVSQCFARACLHSSDSR